MTDLERFERVISELGALLLELRTVGLADDVVLIGAQVVALEQRARNEPVFRLVLPSGIEVIRGFSLDPDVVIDTEDLGRLEHLPEVLRRLGFERSRALGKPSQWSKPAGDSFIHLDLFSTADVDEQALPTPMTKLRGAPRFPLRTIGLDASSSIKVPNPYAYLSLKLEAKLRIRPTLAKDSLDMFAYARVVGSDPINDALSQAGNDAERVRHELGELFGQPHSSGVQDVIAAAGQSMNENERALLERAVVDAFADIIGPTPLKARFPEP